MKRLVSIMIAINLILMMAPHVYAADTVDLSWLPIEITQGYTLPDIPADYPYIVGYSGWRSGNGWTYEIIASRKPMMCYTSDDKLAIYYKDMSQQNDVLRYKLTPNGPQVMTITAWMLAPSYQNIRVIRSNYSISVSPMISKVNLAVSVSSLSHDMQILDKITISVTNNYDRPVSFVISVTETPTDSSTSLTEPGLVYMHCTQVSGVQAAVAATPPLALPPGFDANRDKYTQRMQEIYNQIQDQTRHGDFLGAFGSGFGFLGTEIEYLWNGICDAVFDSNPTQAIIESKIAEYDAYLAWLRDNKSFYLQDNKIGVNETVTFEIPASAINIQPDKNYYLNLFVGSGFLDCSNFFDQFLNVRYVPFSVKSPAPYEPPPYGSGSVDDVDNYNQIIIDGHYQDPPVTPPGGDGSSGGSGSIISPDSSSSSGGGGDSGGNILDKIWGFFSGLGKLISDAFNSILGVIQSVSSFLALIGAVFDFLPGEIWLLITAGIAAVIVLRVLGR